MKRHLIVELEPRDCDKLVDPVGGSRIEIDVDDADTVSIVTDAVPALEGEDRPIERLRFDPPGKTYEGGGDNA